MKERKVSLLTFFRLFKTKKPIAIMGAVFTLLSLFFALMITIVTSSDIQEKYETYDHEAIAKNGVQKIAKVLSVVTLHNVTVNNVNPVVIEYEYDNNGTLVQDKFQTLEIKKVGGLYSGSNIEVKVFNGESIIKDTEPFSFPFEMFYLLPLLFLIVGIPLLLIGLVPALKDYKLYKKGIIKDGYVEYILQNNGLPISGVGRKIVVGYSYLNNGIKVFGESATTDALVLFEKKTGDIIKIFVSEDGTRSCLIPKREAIKNNWNINFV